MAEWFLITAVCLTCPGQSQCVKEHDSWAWCPPPQTHTLHTGPVEHRIHTHFYLHWEEITIISMKRSVFIATCKLCNQVKLVHHKEPSAAASEIHRVKHKHWVCSVEMPKISVCDSTEFIFLKTLMTLKNETNIWSNATKTKTKTHQVCLIFQSLSVWPALICRLASSQQH